MEKKIHTEDTLKFSTQKIEAETRERERERMFWHFHCWWWWEAYTHTNIDNAINKTRETFLQVIIAHNKTRMSRLAEGEKFQREFNRVVR